MAIETTLPAPSPCSRAPIRLAALAAALLLSLATDATAREEFRDRSVIGKWKLVAVLDLASIASLDEAEAKTLLGKTLTISDTAVQVDEELCSPPEFWAERVIPEPHMQEKLHSTAERLRLPNPAIMVELGCTDVYIRNPGQLVLLWGGAMFDAVRIQPERPRPAKALPAAKQPVNKTAPVSIQKAGGIVKTATVRQPGIAPKPAKAKPPRRKARIKTRGASAVNELF